MTNLASTYQSQGRRQEAQNLQVRVLEAGKRLLGQVHPSSPVIKGGHASNPSQPSVQGFLSITKEDRAEASCLSQAPLHKVLFECCLELLSFNLSKDICQVQAPSGLVRNAHSYILDCHIPSEVKYACLFWVEHLQKAGVQLRDNDQVHQFLRGYFLHWLEALAWLGKVSEGILAITTLEGQIQVSLTLFASLQVIANKHEDREKPQSTRFRRRCKIVYSPEQKHL